MRIEFSEEWLKDYCRRTGKPLPDEPDKADARGAPAKKRSKYGNRRTERDGKTFDSKHEADVYSELTLRQKAGEIYAVFCQVPFVLPGGIVYVADFVTLEPSGLFQVLDAKSEATRKDKTYRLKRKLMKNCLGLQIREV